MCLLGKTPFAPSARINHRVKEKVTIPQFTIRTILLYPIRQDHSSPEQVGFLKVLIVGVMRPGTSGFYGDTRWQRIQNPSQPKVVRAERLPDYGGLTIYHQWHTDYG